MEKGKTIIKGNYSRDIAIAVDEATKNDLVNTMEEKMCLAYVQIRKRTCTIYRVHENIRQGDKDAYDPGVISIGPYHRSMLQRKSMEEMEQHKWRYLHDYVSRSPEKRLKDYIDVIKEKEAEARSCYSEEIPLTSDEFVEEMVLDGCFIVELFLKKKQLNLNPKANVQEGKDPIDDIFWMVQRIGFDLLKLENQIPFFILQRLFDIAAHPKEVGTLTKLALDFLPVTMNLNDKNLPKEPNHLLHLLHSSLLPTPPTPCITTRAAIDHKRKKNPLSSFCYYLLNFNRNSTSDVVPEHKSIPCASEMKDAGIKFKKKKYSSSMLDIKFNNGEIEIPHLPIDDSTNSLFRNLIAMEQYSPNAETHFSSYAHFIDCLVNTEKDVALLYKERIITHELGNDNEVALLFNRLCKEIVIDFKDNYLWGTHKDVTDYCETKWHTHRAMLMRDYFSTPWTFCSLMAAIVLLLLTFIQAFFAVYPYIHPPPP